MAGIQPAAEVTLYHRNSSASAVAVFDSGSVYTVFSPEYAALLDIEDLTAGIHAIVNTLGGTRHVYLFGLEIRLPEAGPRFAAQIGFFEGHAARNILGRNVIFANFEIGFRESTQSIHLRSEI